MRRSTVDWHPSCSPPGGAAARPRPGKAVGPGPSRTSSPRCGGAPPVSNGWRPSPRKPSAQTLIKDGAAIPGLWCLGRLGARVPLYGPANTVVPPEVAGRWITALLDRSFADGRETTDALFALAQMARVSGDRVRDVDETLRQRVIERLEALGADETILRPVRAYHELEAEQQGEALGDALPSGLRLSVSRA